MLAKLPDGSSNPNTYSYSNYDLTAKKHLVADQPGLGSELIIRLCEQQFTIKYTLVIKRFLNAGAFDIKKELQDGDADSELNGDLLVVA